MFQIQLGQLRQRLQCITHDIRFKLHLFIHLHLCVLIIPRPLPQQGEQGRHLGVFEGVGVSCIAQGFGVGVIFFQEEEDVVFGDGGEGVGVFGCGCF